MYDRDTIELALLALEEGDEPGEGRRGSAGVAHHGGNWERGRLPHARSEARPSAHAASTASCWDVRPRCECKLNEVEGRPTRPR